jgi:hypothetical protein
MTKGANRRAFFVCVALCLMYVSVALKLPDRLSMKRVADERGASSTSMNLVGEHMTPHRPERKDSQASGIRPVIMTKVAAPADQASYTATKGGERMEPSLFIAVPLVCAAIKEGILEKDGLIFVAKAGYNNAGCKTPIDILRDRDEQGLKQISRIIDKKQSLNLLKKEGIILREDLTREEIILGRGYAVDKGKLLSLYDRYCPQGYEQLFPFVINRLAIVKTRRGFELTRAQDGLKNQPVNGDPEWMVPNLANLPMRTAIEKLAVHTSKVTVFGSGSVREQYPRAFERIRGETECVIYGRTYQ